MKRKPQIIIGIILIVIFVLLAVAAPLLAPNDPNATDLALKNAPPSAEYPLGCDQMGRCELSRLIYGARYSLGLSIPVLIILASLSLFIGCYSSYKSGIVDEIMRLICDIFMAFPLIVIAMSLVSAVDNSVASIIIAIGISMTTWFLRMVRSYAKTECGKEYIEAARISGASNFRIVTRHLIPNVLPQFIVYFTTGIATAIMSVSFNVSIRLIVKANDTGLEHTTISLEKLVDMSDGLTLTTMQEAIASKEATIRQVGISIIGVTLFLLLFSIITFASTIITNIATKKREYAMFQSIGMTRKQTEKMALCESCVLAIGSLILTLILGIILGQILIKGLISAGIFYLSYTFPLALFTVYCIVVVLIILMITISAFYSLQKTPLVERLRIVD